MMRVPAKITAIRQESPSVKSYVLAVDDAGFSFQPGQWLDVYVDIDGETRVGGYSITTSPLEQGQIGLAIKRADRHPVTRYLHERARVGDVVLIDGGHGHFVYRREMGGSLVLIAAGVGITPMMSILRYVDQAARDVRVTLIYGASSPEELVFREELEAMGRRNRNLRCIYTVSQAQAESWRGRRGRIDAELLDDVQLDPEGLYYVCGPKEMVEDTAATLEAMGVPAERVIYEKWW